MAADRLRTITVGKLIELLQDEDPDKKVIFSTDYGDYHHTKQALGIRGDVEDMLIEKSAYSNSGFALADDDREESERIEDGEERETYLLIS